MVKSSITYLIGQILVLLTGFISFPILARILTVEQFGIMSLLNLTILLVVGISKAGLTKAAVRFAPENNNPEKKTVYISNLLISETILASLFGIGLYMLIKGFNYPNPQLTGQIALGVAGLVIIRAITQIFLGILQGEELSTLHTLITTIQKYLGIGFAFVGIWYFNSNRIAGFFFGFSVAEALILLPVAFEVLRRYPLRFTAMDSVVLRSYFKYGIPLLASEMVYILLAQSDRYILEVFHTSYLVGIYSAAYNLASIIQRMITVPLSLALMPYLIRQFKNGGVPLAQVAINKTFNYYLLLALPVIVGGSVLSGDLLQLIAGEKYMDAVAIIPLLLFGVMLYGIYYIHLSGLMLKLSTGAITKVMLGVTGVNIALNFLFVPKFGMWAAAVTTLIGYSILVIATRKITPAEFRPSINWLNILHIIVATGLMGGIMIVLKTTNLLLNILILPMIGLMVYLIILIMINKNIRMDLKELASNVYARLQKRTINPASAS